MLGNPQSIYNIHKLYADLEQKIKNPALTNQQKLTECDRSPNNWTINTF